MAKKKTKDKKKSKSYNRNPYATDPIMRKGHYHEDERDDKKEAYNEIDEELEDMGIDPDVLTNVRIK